jgi:hypothetical protein
MVNVGGEEKGVLVRLFAPGNRVVQNAQNDMDCFGQYQWPQLAYKLGQDLTKLRFVTIPA